MKIQSYLFLLFGICSLIGAFFSFWHTVAFLSTAVRTEGTVIEFIDRGSQSDISDRNTTAYSPVIRFSSQSNEQIEFTSSTSSTKPSYVKGEKIEVLYQPDEPHKAKINSFFSLWGLALILTGIGSFFAPIGWWLIKRGNF